jgi:hypothetical protein
VLSPRQFADIHRRTATPGTGGTINPNTGKWPTKGWATAITGHQHIEPTETYTPESLASYTGQHREALSQPGHHLGIWHQPGEGAYLDVSRVRPETYRGGVESIAAAYHGRQGLEGPHKQEQSIYRISKGQTLSMHPASEGERTETTQAMKGLRKKQPKAKPIAEMSTKKLSKAFRSRG